MADASPNVPGPWVSSDTGDGTRPLTSSDVMGRNSRCSLLHCHTQKLFFLFMRITEMPMNSPAPHTTLQIPLDVTLAASPKCPMTHVDGDRALTAHPPAGSQPSPVLPRLLIGEPLVSRGPHPSSGRVMGQGPGQGSGPRGSCGPLRIKGKILRAECKPKRQESGSGSWLHPKLAVGPARLVPPSVALNHLGCPLGQQVGVLGEGRAGAEASTRAREEQFRAPRWPSSQKHVGGRSSSWLPVSGPVLAGGEDSL